VTERRHVRSFNDQRTTEVDGHLSTSYLKKEIERLRFGPPAADDAKSLLVAGGISKGGSKSVTARPLLHLIGRRPGPQAPPPETDRPCVSSGLALFERPKASYDARRRFVLGAGHRIRTADIQLGKVRR
jgi:hypothetical protein